MHSLGTLLLVLATTSVPPVLEFPEPGLDDPSAYRGYHTRIYRDARDNSIQFLLDGRSGRVVAVWADGANQSLGFTVRDAGGRPVAPTWGPRAAEVGGTGDVRAVTVRLRLLARPLVIGHIALGSMRWERDLQYQDLHLAPFDSTLPPVPEQAELVRRLAGLDLPERELHLALLAAPDVAALRGRLAPTIAPVRQDTLWTVRVEQPTLDGRNWLRLELSGSARATAVTVARDRIAIRPRAGRSWTLDVRVETDAPALTALGRERIFDPEFFAFYEGVRREGESAPRFRRLERQVRGAELLSYEEKLMAGLPNFATYFGRDMMMTALMMEPVWAPAMLEHVVGSVLRKVSDAGEVSHEEALGGQAIRERAAEYAALLAAAEATPARRDSLLARARGQLVDLQAVRENYHMLDDDFQLPVVAARWLAHAGLSGEGKRRFLLAPARDGRPATRLEVLIRNFRHVAARAAPYAEAPAAASLVSFRARDDGRGYGPASWRDSGAGYAGGRFAMDINVIWVPAALGAVAACLDSLRALGLPVDSLAGRGAAARPAGSLDAVALAALGTVADVVPLHDENRILVRHGLARLRKTRSRGLDALLKAAQLDQKAKLAAMDIGFGLAPRLNAAGRLGTARLAVELLTTLSAERATELARHLDDQNQQRQTLERRWTGPEARQAFLKIVERHPNSTEAPRARFLIGEAYYREGEYEKAIKKLKTPEIRQMFASIK